MRLTPLQAILGCFVLLSLIAIFTKQSLRDEEQIDSISEEIELRGELHESYDERVTGSFTDRHEAYYQAIAAKLLDGDTEVTLGDRTRCDIVTATHAIEVDWNSKWGESIGQSLNYAFQTNKRAGIILVMDTPTDTKEAIRVNSIIRHYELPVTLWVIDKQSEVLALFSEE